MGVPGFFKWLSLRYPHIIETAKKPPRSKTDFLYLDINALFHAAIRNKAVSKKPQTPRRVLSRVFKEMDTAFNICEPQILVYIAMDGVAPRAKMNEQRSRRYLAQDKCKSMDQVFSDSNNTSSSESLNEDKLKNGKGSGFFVPVDSVAISAGTSFMQAANDAIKFYIYQRLNGKARNLQIIFNDSSVAGEGEHKIFQFLNAQRKQPGYNPKFKHMVCGGDADFIMYALLTHEPNLRILRPTNDKYVVLNINRLRKHIIHDMVVPQLTAEINEENIIEDFVCIINLLGNDFLPRITYLRETRVELLFQAYRNYFNESRTYIINKGGFINMERFLIFIKFLGEEIFSLRMLSSISVGCMNSEAAIRANDYVKAICWTLQYYSGDCPSWKFYYPHHKSPSIQDILNHVHAESFDQTFNADTPMRLFEQLMYIIPPVCQYLLPEPFRGLLTDPKSPVIEYYPREFSCSNSKAILPFIDEKVLSQAMEPRYSLLSAEDTRRDCADRHMQIYAGRDSTKYSTIYSLCTTGDEKFIFPANSDFYGQLFYDGPTRISVVDSPISEWHNIYRNSVVNAEYRLPSIPKNSDLNITNKTLTSTSKSLYRSSLLSCSSKNERKSGIVQSNPNVINGNTNIHGGYSEQSNTNTGFLANRLKEANTGAGVQLSSVQSRPISVNLASQSRNYGTAFPDFATNTSSSQSLVECLGLSDINDQKNTRSHAQVQNRTFQTGNGRYFANKNQKNVILNNQDIRQRQFNHYNTANYDKNSYSNRKY